MKERVTRRFEGGEDSSWFCAAVTLLGDEVESVVISGASNPNKRVVFKSVGIMQAFCALCDEVVNEVS